MQINVSTRKLATILAAAIAVLLAAGFCAEYARYVLGSKSALVDYFSLSEEQNLPTWWSSLLLLSCSVVLWSITTTKPKGPGAFRTHWAVLAAMFCYMSLDELVEIHEWLNDLPTLQNLHGPVYYGWVIPAGVVVLVFAASYLRFLNHLPRETRIKVASAGACYVGGAVGVEILLGMWTDRHGELNFSWAMIDMGEEILEMIGASLFLYALVEYLGRTAPDLRIAIRPRSDGEAGR
jgi:hypothetical protein